MGLTLPLRGTDRQGKAMEVDSSTQLVFRKIRKIGDSFVTPRPASARLEPPQQPRYPRPLKVNSELEDGFELRAFHGSLELGLPMQYGHKGCYCLEQQFEDGGDADREAQNVCVGSPRQNRTIRGG